METKELKEPELTAMGDLRNYLQGALNLVYLANKRGGKRVC